MTGEITLRGKVLAIGGLKEKALAAVRSGIREIIIPKGKERDIKDIPADIVKDVRFIIAENVNDVFKHAFEK